MTIRFGTRFIAPLLGAGLLAAGCGRQEPAATTTPPPPPPMAERMTAPKPPPPPAQPAPGAMAAPVAAAKDVVGQLVQAFSGSDPTTRDTVEQIAAAMKASEYSKALPLLQQLLASAQLSSEQQQAVNGTVTTARKEMANQAAADPAKAATDLQKSLPGLK